MQTCNGCDEYVSDAFARVFGDNEDRVNRCPNCAISAEYGLMGSAVE